MPIPMLSLFLAFAAAPQEGPAERFEKYMRPMKTIAVDIELTVQGVKDVGRGTLLFKPPTDELFRMKWGESNYSFSVHKGVIVAIEHGRKRYRDYGKVQELFFMPENDISSTPQFGFPLPIPAKSLKALVPPGTAYESLGKQTVGGVTVDAVKGSFMTQTGMVHITAKVDAQGRLLEYIKERGGAPSITVRLSNYRLNQPIPDKAFVTPVPLGYVPHTLPVDPYPMNVAEPFPFQGWKPLKGAPGLDKLRSGKVLFVAIGDPECEASKRSEGTIAELVKALAQKGVACAALSLSPSPSQKPTFAFLPVYFDPTGKGMERLAAPGTPLYYLVSPKGVIARIWYGFDPAQSKAFIKDALEWLPKVKDPIGGP